MQIFLKLLSLIVCASLMTKCKSENNNLTWSLTSAPSTVLWSAINSDASGQYLVAFQSQKVYMSGTYGEKYFIIRL